MLLVGSDKKRIVNQILGDDPNKKGEEKSSLHMLMEELFSSIESKDVNGAVDGLRALIGEFNAPPAPGGQSSEGG